MDAKERELLIEEEALIVRHSGEIPEIALHSSLYYITEDKEGPGLSLVDEERKVLYEAVLTRHKEIILRDLDPENRDKTLYRGVARTIANRQRFLNLCQRLGYDCLSFDSQIADALVLFLQQETEDVATGRRSSSINCDLDELRTFVAELGLDPSLLPSGWESLCFKSD